MFKLLVFFLIYFVGLSVAAISSSSFVIPANPVTTCFGVCCSKGVPSYTTDFGCTDANGFRGFFTTIENTTCPPAAIVTPVAGCTIVNNTAAGCKITQYWGYNNIANVAIVILKGVYNEFTNIMGAREDEGQPTFFLPGLHKDTFTVIADCDKGPIPWNITYDGWVTVVTPVNYTTCEGYCCNSTFCRTTNDSTCSMIQSGTVKWGGYNTNCTNGQVVTDDTPLPCPCTAQVNNGYTCGKLRPIEITGCVINRGDSTTTVAFNYNNTNTETYNINVGADNLFTGTILSGGLTTSFLPGYYYRAENITYISNVQVYRNVTIRAIFDNY